MWNCFLFRTLTYTLLIGSLISFSLPPCMPADHLCLGITHTPNWICWTLKKTCQKLVPTPCSRQQKWKVKRCNYHTQWSMSTGIVCRGRPSLRSMPSHTYYVCKNPLLKLSLFITFLSLNYGQWSKYISVLLYLIQRKVLWEWKREKMEQRLHKNPNTPYQIWSMKHCVISWWKWDQIYHICNVKCTSWLNIQLGLTGHFEALIDKFNISYNSFLALTDT